MALFSEKNFAAVRGAIRAVNQPAQPVLGTLDLSSEGIALLNERGQITEINAQALRLLMHIAIPWWTRFLGRRARAG